MSETAEAVFKAHCQSCDSCTEVNLVQFLDPQGESVGERQVNQIYEQLSCEKCNSSFIKVSDSTGRVIIDPLNLSPCRICGCPIEVPRKVALPETNICSNCIVDNNEHGDVAKHIPEPIRLDEDLIPDELKSCPKCGSRTLLKRNRKTQERFIGCLAFPVCRWGASLPTTYS